jgi:AcrR family transcriptional regulator
MKTAVAATSRPATKPDGRRLRGERTRQVVLNEAIRIASVEGLEGLTFGRVAQAAGMPKSTLQALFKDREALQSQTLSAGAEAFAHGIRARLPKNANAFENLVALCHAWFDLVSDGELPGGCLVTAATAEYRARPGSIQTLVAEHRDRWRAALFASAQAAQKEGTLRGDLDLDQLVFEILAFQGSANANAVELAANELSRARHSVDSLLERARASTVAPARKRAK